MALTLGTNAYIDLATFKSWCDLRGYDYGTPAGYQDSNIEAAIVRSSVDYIDISYDFKGLPESDTQSMQLPTNEVAIADIENGAAQAAWQELNGLLFVAQSTDSASGEVKRTMDKLDVLETEVEYVEGSAKTYTYSTTKISRFLAPFVVGGSGGLRALRA